MSEDQANWTADDAGSPAELLELLEMAVRFRQHALLFSDDPMGAHLEKYADELEARARTRLAARKALDGDRKD
jgi:hypothetical protein